MALVAVGSFLIIGGVGGLFHTAKISAENVAKSAERGYIVSRVGPSKFIEHTLMRVNRQVNTTIDVGTGSVSQTSTEYTSIIEVVPELNEIITRTMRYYFDGRCTGRSQETILRAEALAKAERIFSKTVKTEDIVKRKEYNAGGLIKLTKDGEVLALSDSRGFINAVIDAELTTPYQTVVSTASAVSIGIGVCCFITKFAEP